MKITVMPSLEKETLITEVRNDELGRRTALIFEGEDIEVRDEYHSMHELYQHRMALNIALFNMIERVSHWDSAAETLFDNDYKVVKSKMHSDGTMFDGYFIVMLIVVKHENGEYRKEQISYHYKMKHWDKFQIPEVERTPPYDGHSAKDVLERLMSL